jgi:hypothetical protein
VLGTYLRLFSKQLHRSARFENTACFRN